MAKTLEFVRVFVDALTNLFPEPARFYVLDQEGTRSILFTERLMQKVQYAQPCVEAYKVNHLEWPHRMVQSKL